MSQKVGSYHKDFNAMFDVTDPVIQWALIIMVSVIAGTSLLIFVAFFRRWQQIRYARSIHILQRQYRPVLAKVLSGGRNRSDIEALRELPLSELEILIDPIFSKRRLPESCRIFLQALCAELGLVGLWQRRVANGRLAASARCGNGGHRDIRAQLNAPHLERIKSIRNLGALHHNSSWPLLVEALDDDDSEVQFVALRALAALAAPDSFAALRDRLDAVVQGLATSPPAAGLHAAMASFDLTCASALLPSLQHMDRQIRLHSTEILRTMVYRRAARQPRLILDQQLLAPQVVEWLLAELAADTSAEIRARAAEVIVFLSDPRTTSVLQSLLLDRHWFVRHRTVLALARRFQAEAPLRLEIRESLRDPHWRVREAAIQTLISLGATGKVQLFEHFLTSPNHAIRGETVEMIERTGLMSDLVKAYSEGTRGVDALVVEELASEAAPFGLSGILRTLNPEVRLKFLERFLPNVEARLRFNQEVQNAVESYISPQQVLNFPPQLAA